jgi:TonB-linked SusC/RagA family outer membrane protein
MKKFSYWERFVLFYLHQKLLKIMKLTLLLGIVGTWGLSAASSYSQETQLSLNLTNATITELLKTIGEKSEFSFWYNSNVLNDGKEITMNVKGMTIDKILDLALTDQNLSYTIKDKVILIYKPSQSGEAAAKQQQKITGLVTDGTTGEVLPGVTIKVEGTTLGVVTDIEGKFTLEVPSPDAVLLFSFVGYNTEKVSVSGKSEISVSLIPDMQALNEVVVVGYGVMQKRDVLGAISSVKSNDVTLSTNSSIASALEGKAAGLYIRQNSAQPGGGLDIFVRGQGAKNASNDSLFVVDGFPIAPLNQPGSENRYDAGTTSILNSFNPNDIESVEVLKDASSTAIYGARAANGVVLITTKRGKEGKPSVEYSTNRSFQKYENSFDILPLNEWMQVRNEAAWENWNFQNKVYPYGNKTLAEAQANPVGLDFHTLYTQHAIDNVGGGTNWFDLVTRNGSIQQHNLTLSGGNEATRYLISGNYYDHEGIVKKSGIKRYSFRTNIDQKVNRYIKLGLSLTGSRILNDNSQLGDQPYENSGIIRAALQQGPHILAIDENGDYPLNPQLPTQPNPYSLLTITDIGRVDRMLLNTFLDLTPVKDLTITLKAGMDRGISNRSTYLPRTTMAGALENGRASISEIDNSDYLMEATANYTKTFWKHHKIILLAGANRQHTVDAGSSERNSNFITDAFLWNNLSAGTGTKFVKSSKTENTIISYFGRAFYSYDNKYLATLSMRTDGAGVFAKNLKWGTFPSVSVGWNVAEKSFLNNYKNVVSQFKIRVGYGKTGNASINSNAFSASSAYIGWLSGSDNPLIAVSEYRLENPDLKWETTTETNIGLDFSFLKDLFSGSFDMFHRVISDLLDTKQLDSYHAVNSVIANVGETQSKGFEVTLISRIIRRANFTWTSTLNVSRYKDNWLKRAPDWKPSVYEGEKDPLRPTYPRIADGIMQIGEIVPAQPDLIPGQIKIKDIDGYKRDNLGNLAVDANGRFIRLGKPDGIIDDADTKLLGTSDPGYIAGFTNNFTYKNVFLKVHFNGMFDRKLADPNDMAFGVSADDIYTYGYNALRSVKNRWTPDHPSTTRPGSFYGSSNYGYGDFFLQDAWFIRLQNIPLGYTIPKKWVKNIASITAHVDADNLFVITPYKGVDPETDSYTAAYPNVRTYTIGLNVKF